MYVVGGLACNLVLTVVNLFQKVIDALDHCGLEPLI